MTVSEIAHYAYFSMLSSEEEENVENIVARDLADIENKINEHTNAKLNKMIREIDSEKAEFQYCKLEDLTWDDALDTAMEIIKKEITKKD